MSREIKFRAWDIKGKEMLVAWPLPTIYPSDVLYSTQSIGVRPDDKRFELMQYTGLHDRNGVEIYEGDIVELQTIDICRIAVAYGTQEFADDAYQAYCLGWNLDPTYNGYEVIGNIYENPDLLKEHNHGE